MLHHTVRTRTRFFRRKGSGTFFVYQEVLRKDYTERVNEQRQGIIVWRWYPAFLLCGIKFALCELDRHLYGALMAIAAYVRTGSLYTSGKV